jgi:CrcB protein
LRPPAARENEPAVPARAAPELEVDMERLVWICLAGGLGTGTRYLTTIWATERFGARFPFGTAIVNVAGCFAIAFLVDVTAALAWPPTVRAAMSVGFLGGLTTYSSFNLETIRLVQEGAVGTACSNLVVTVVGGLLAGVLGVLAARLVLGR